MDESVSVRYRKLKSPVGVGLAEAEEESGKTFYDMASGFVERVDRWSHVIAICVIAVLAYYFVGWYALTGVVVGSFVWYIAFMTYLTPRGEVVDVYDAEEKTFDTWMIGRELFASLRKKGGVSPVVSSSGTIRYMATHLDLKAGLMTTSWVSELSPFQYMVDFTTHCRLLKLFESMLDEMLDKIGYPSVFGKLRAKEVLHNFVDFYDGRLDRVEQLPGFKREHVHPHELVETPENSETEGVDDVPGH